MVNPVALSRFGRKRGLGWIALIRQEQRRIVVRCVGERRCVTCQRLLGRQIEVGLRRRAEELPQGSTLPGDSRLFLKVSAIQTSGSAVWTGTGNARRKARNRIV